MKLSVKKKLMVAGVTFIMLLSAASVSAAPATVRPMPGSNQSSGTTTSGTTTSGTTSGTSSSGSSGNSVTSSGTSASDETSVSGEGNYRATDDDESNVSRPVPTAMQSAPEATLNVVSSVDSEQTAVANKKYVSKGGLAVWIIISMIINAIISFCIGNRFYKLSQKDSHITAEIRALRRDVDEKFLQSVKGFTEQETDIANANDDYSMSDEGITIPQRQPRERREPVDDEFRKWETQMDTRSTRNTRSVRTSRPERESFDEFDQPSRRKRYQPMREEIADDIQDEEYENDHEDKKSGLNSVKNKAKEFLGDIFPFKED